MIHRSWWKQQPTAEPAKHNKDPHYSTPNAPLLPSRYRFCLTPTYLYCEAQEQEEEISSSWTTTIPPTTNTLDLDDPSPSFHYELMKVPDRMFDSNHVVFGQLCRNKDLLPRYNVYKRVYHDNDTLLEKKRVAESSPMTTMTTTTTTSLDSGTPWPPTTTMTNGEGSKASTTSTIGNDDSDTTIGRELIVADIQLGTKLEGHDNIVHGGILGLLCDDLMGFAYYALGDVPFAVTANLTLDYRTPVPSGTHVIVRLSCIKRERRKLTFEGQMTSPDGKIVYVDVSALMIIPRKYYYNNEEEQ